MAFWRKESPNTNDPASVPPATVGENVDVPGDPNGVILEALEEAPRLTWPTIVPSAWSGWPADWDTPLWSVSDHLGRLVDTAWACLDVNASVLSTMPVYKTTANQIVDPETWMANPDPDLYSSWEEFAKQLFWDFQMGEVFVLATARYSDGWPARFHVVKPCLVKAEMAGGIRRYRIGNADVTGDILHIRYQSTTDDARGHGPLEAGAPRLVAAAALSKYANELATGGGIPHYLLEVDRQLTAKQASDLLDQWWQSRTKNLGRPAVLSGGVTARQMQTNAKDMALVELAQFNESRIAVLLGVPPFLVGLPSGGDSMTYSNVSSLFDYHDRRSLRPMARHVMSALSNWTLPRGSAVELNRDEYTRPDLAARAAAYAVLHGIEDETGRVLSADQIARMERIVGALAPEALTGGSQ